MIEKIRLRAVPGCVWGCALALGLCVGCTQAVYEIQMDASGDSLHREITFWHHTGEESRTTATPPEELEAIARVYQAETPKGVVDKHHFASDFRGNTPSDVGGAGWYEQFACPMGKLRAYTERFRGMDDLSTDLDQRLKSLDRLVDLVAEFITTQTAGRAEAEPVVAFVQKELRRDLHNLCLYVWAGSIAGHYEEKADEEIGVRVAQYLIERQYMKPSEAPRLLRVFLQAGDEDYKPLLLYFQRLFARKTGVPDEQPVPAHLVELLDETRLVAAVTQFAEKQPEYRTLVAKWQEGLKVNADRPKPEPVEIFGDLAVDAFWPGITFLAASDALTVRLKTPHEPEMTNGKWDAATSSVEWSRRLSGRSAQQREWPAVLYAYWTELDEAFQTKHFGKVVAQGDALIEYCLWHRGLTAEQAASWDTFIDELKPGDELVDRIKRFHFPGEPAVEDIESPPLSEADIGKSVILESLTGQAWPPRAEPPHGPIDPSASPPSAPLPSAPLPSAPLPSAPLPSAPLPSAPLPSAPLPPAP